MIELKKVSFRYKDSEQDNSLTDVNLSIQDGEVVLICGGSGCGKTTITRLLNGLIPSYYEGQLAGEVLLDGENISKQPIHKVARKVGSVFQNPRTQFFNIDSTSELIFRCENLAVPVQEIGQYLDTAAKEFGIEELMGRNLFHLSGGEKQKIACASVSIPMPDIFVLDEPTSNLDWHSIWMLKDIILRWKAQGKTVIVAEHRLSYLKGVADRVIYMDSGEIKEDMPADTFWSLSADEIKRRGLRSTSPVSFCSNVRTPHSSDCYSVKDFSFHYKDGIGIEIPSLSIPKGAIVGIIGENGAGKTTFARCLCGLEKRARGLFSFGTKTYSNRQRLKICYLVMQDVNHQLFTESVEDEIAISVEHTDDAHREKMVDEILHDMDLTELKSIHPLSLSGGQKQRVAIGSAIASKKEIMIFDEPTSGLDYRHMLEVSNCLKKLSDIGKTSLIITHDPELIAECCDYFVFIENGTVKWYGPFDVQNGQRVQKFFGSAEGGAL